MIRVETAAAWSATARILALSARSTCPCKSVGGTLGRQLAILVLGGDEDVGAGRVARRRRGRIAVVPEVDAGDGRRREQDHQGNEPVPANRDADIFQLHAVYDPLSARVLDTAASSPNQQFGPWLQ